MAEITRELRFAAMRRVAAEGDMVPVPMVLRLKFWRRMPATLTSMASFWGALEVELAGWLRRFQGVSNGWVRLRDDVRLEHFISQLAVQVAQPCGAAHGWHFALCEVQIGVTETALVYGPGEEQRQREHLEKQLAAPGGRKSKRFTAACS